MLACCTIVQFVQRGYQEFRQSGQHLRMKAIGVLLRRSAKIAAQQGNARVESSHGCHGGEPIGVAFIENGVLSSFAVPFD